MRWSFKKQAAHPRLPGGRLSGRAKEIAQTSVCREHMSRLGTALVAAARLGRAAARLAADRLAARLAAAALHAVAQVAEGAAAGLAARGWLAAAWLGRAAGRLGVAASRLAAARLAARRFAAAAEHVAQAATGLAAGIGLAAARLGLAAGRLTAARLAAARTTTARTTAAAVGIPAHHAVEHLERLGLGGIGNHKQGGQQGHRQDNTRSHGEGSFSGTHNLGDIDALFLRVTLVSSNLAGGVSWVMRFHAVRHDGNVRVVAISPTLANRRTRRPLLRQCGVRFVQPVESPRASGAPADDSLPVR